MYRLSVDVRPSEGVVYGTQHVRFVPDLDTDRLVLRLWANSPRIARAGGAIRVTASDPQGFEQPNATTFVLRRELQAGVPFEFALAWELTLPSAPINDRVSRSGDAVRLGSFFPIVAWEPGVGWAEEPPTSGFAEASLSVPSDFDVTVKVPEGLGVLATGIEDRPGHWVAEAVVDWAVSVGRFRLAEGEAAAGEGGAPVRVVVGADSQVEDDPASYRDKVVRSLEDFARRYGPYPWPVYSLALTPTLSGGIEYPMHVFQGPGTIGRTTSHEVAHMWFYALVPTNQGRDPWIDEGLATWAEGRFEGTTASIMQRPIPEAGRGRAGEPMSYWEPRTSVYFRSVYIQGAQAVGALGDGDLVDCALRFLVARQAFEVTDTGEVKAALSATFPDAVAVLERYL